MTRRRREKKGKVQSPSAIFLLENRNVCSAAGAKILKIQVSYAAHKTKAYHPRPRLSAKSWT